MTSLTKLELKWVDKLYGQEHYCHDSNGKIVARISEAHTGICTAYIKNNDEVDELYGQYIDDRTARKAIEAHLVDQHEMIEYIFS